MLYCPQCHNILVNYSATCNMMIFLYILCLSHFPRLALVVLVLQPNEVLGFQSWNFLCAGHSRLWDDTLKTASARMSITWTDDTDENNYLSPGTVPSSVLGL